MDRFIAVHTRILHLNYANLKSNMDRFIVSLIENNKRKLTDLKSNMDRFIVKHNIVETFVKII